MTRPPGRSDPDRLTVDEALALVRSRLRDRGGDQQVRQAVAVLTREIGLAPPPSLADLEREVDRLDAQVRTLRERAARTR